MMETIDNLELHIPYPQPPDSLKGNKDLKKLILLFSISHVDCVDTVVTFKCLYSFFFFFVYTFFKPFTLWTLVAEYYMTWEM